MLKRLLRLRGGPEAVAERLYLALVTQARQPMFFQVLGVPDTVLGRFEMISLHAFMLFQRLRDTEDGALAQDVHDVMFADMDRSLREMGVGDLGVGKRVKKLASNLYGRIAAYEQGLAGDDATLAAALRRNLFATADANDARCWLWPAICGARWRRSAANRRRRCAVARSLLRAADGAGRRRGGV